MSDWDQDTPDGSNTAPPSRQPEQRSWASNRGIMATVGAVILVALAAATFGYLSQNGSGSHRPTNGAQVSAPSPTATPAPTATPSPTVAPSPTATPIPVILAVTPTSVANFSTDCGGGQGYRTCAFTLSNQSSTMSLNWTGTATVSSGADVTKYLHPASGAISPGGTATASFTIAAEAGVCGPGQTITLRFNGPSNTAIATIQC